MTSHRSMGVACLLVLASVGCQQSAWRTRSADLADELSDRTGITFNTPAARTAVPTWTAPYEPPADVDTVAAPTAQPSTPPVLQRSAEFVAPPPPVDDAETSERYKALFLTE